MLTKEQRYLNECAKQAGLVFSMYVASFLVAYRTSSNFMDLYIDKMTIYMNICEAFTDRLYKTL